jgi:ABC-type amino acid transport substrate-binding protein
MLKKVCLLPAILLVVLIGIRTNDLAPESQNKTLVMACAVSNDTFEGRVLDLVYREAFRRLGVDFEYRHYPAKRASLMADEGRVDGELARVYAYEQQHPELIRVEEALFSTRFVAVASTPEIKLDGWESLRGTTYRVEYVRGHQRAHDRLIEVVEPGRLSAISSWRQGLKKLILGRTDVFVDSEFVINNLLKQEEFQSANLMVVGVMEEISLHAYLHKRHAPLAAQLSAVLKDIKSEGLIEQYATLARAEQEQP